MKARRIFIFFIVSVLIVVGCPLSAFATTSANSNYFNAINNILFVKECTPALSGGGFSGASPSGENVTWIGDSYTVMADEDNLIQEKLPGVDLGDPISGDHFSLHSYSRVGKNLAFSDATVGGQVGESGLTLLRQIIGNNKLRPYIILALGTNNPDGYWTKASYSGFTEIFTAISELTGNSNVILTTAATNDGSDYSEFNKAVKDFATSHDNFYVADWAAVAKSDLFSGDNVHPNNEGIKLWVDTIISALPSSGGSSMSSNSSASLNSAGEAVNYKGDVIFTSDELAKIKEYQPVYEEAVKGTGLPWQVLAAIHNMENSLSINNPTNHQGIFQFYTDWKNGVYFPDDGQPASQEEFLSQARRAATEFVDVIKSSNYEPSTEEGIKFGFFAYNGTANVYKNQALALGFSQEQAAVGEGSPYVMNRMDAQRDPTVEPTRSNGTWGQIKRDNGPIEYPANEHFGGFVQFAALAGGNWASTGGLSDANGCLVNPSNAISNDIATTARNLAWPDEEHLDKVNPQFILAAQKLGRGERDYCPSYRANTGRDWSGNSLSPTNRAQLDYSQDCGVFVSTVIQSTGIDPDFPDAGTSALEEHMDKSTLWQEIPNDGTTNNLKPGDVFVWNQGGGIGANGHTLIYVGNNETASASLCNRTGNIRSFDKEGDTTKYRIFRSTVQTK